MGKKSLCGWNKKRIAQDMEQLCAIIREPSFVCGNCARAAADRKRLCNPTAIAADDKGKKQRPDKKDKKK